MSIEKDGNKALKKLNEMVPTIVPDERKRKLGKMGNKYVKELRPEYDRIFKRIMAGGKPKEIGEELGYSEEWVCKVWRSDVGLARIDELSRKQDIQLVRNRIKFLSGDALTVLEEIIKSKDTDILELRARVAKDILKLGGVEEPEERKVTFEHIFKVIRTAIEEVSEEEEMKTVEGEVEEDT